MISYVRLALGFANFLVGENMSVESPPLAIESTETTAVSGEFVNTCMEEYSRSAKDLGWHLLGTSLTYNGRWGLIWRADIQTQSQGSSSRLGRVLCWRSPDGILHLQVGYGISVDPLPEAGNFHSGNSEDMA